MANSKELETFKVFAITTAMGAGRILSERHGKVKRLEWKLLTNFRTEADQESDSFIRQAIERTFPDHNILSEESADKLTASGYWWVVDPIDGTIPYTREVSDHFAVLIALCDGRTPIVGVTFCPLRNSGRGELYAAVLGQGAFCNGRPIRVADDDDLHHAIVGLDPGKAPGRLRSLDVEAKLLGNDGVLCTMKSACASVPMALTASGKINAYIYTNAASDPYSLAAGAILCREAGAKVTTLVGKDWEIGDDTILIANPSLHAKLMERLRS